VKVALGFVLCPAFAFLLTKIIPMAGPYALGLLFLGMAPGARFCPRWQEAKATWLTWRPSLMLTAVGTVIYMPRGAVLVKAFPPTPGISRPRFSTSRCPLAIRVAIRLTAEAFCGRTSDRQEMAVIDTLIMLVLVDHLWKDFLNAVGSYAIRAQICFAPS
jgi:BASS family bile acid:Na+ symporter